LQDQPNINRGDDENYGGGNDEQDNYPADVH